MNESVVIYRSGVGSVARQWVLCSQ